MPIRKRWQPHREFFLIEMAGKRSKLYMQSLGRSGSKFLRSSSSSVYKEWLAWRRGVFFSIADWNVSHLYILRFFSKNPSSFCLYGFAVEKVIVTRVGSSIIYSWEMPNLLTSRRWSWTDLSTVAIHLLTPSKAKMMDPPIFLGKSHAPLAILSSKYIIAVWTFTIKNNYT